MEIKDGLQKAEGEIGAFLLIGQSNMAGRGEFADVAPISNKLCYMLRMGRWQKMSEPINPDRAILEGKFHSGVGLSASFADDLANATGERVGLIPCADGGTALSQWMPGTVLYDHAVMQCKLAQRSSRLRGILWHQGETDCIDDARVDAYKEKFIIMITALRRDLGDETLPVVIGELSHHIDPVWGRAERVERFNGILAEIAREVPYCALVGAEGLGMKPDGIHFDAVSYRELGHRYYRAYAALAKNAK